jgi:hypothetical protein
MRLGEEGLLDAEAASLLRERIEPNARQNNGAPPARRSPGVSEVAALRAKVEQRKREQDAQIMDAMVGSNVIMGTQGLVPAANLPPEYQQMRGPNGERPIGLDPRKLNPELLAMLMGGK